MTTAQDVLTFDQYEASKNDADVDEAKRRGKELALKLYDAIVEVERLMARYQENVVDGGPEKKVAVVNFYFWKWMQQNGKAGLKGDLQTLAPVITSFLDSDATVWSIPNYQLKQAEQLVLDVAMHLILKGNVTAKNHSRVCSVTKTYFEALCDVIN
jgi:hypothetical protein